MGAPTCPTCDQPAMAKKTPYGVKHACCGLWSWGNAPLVDRATHEARKLAHATFDPLWKGGPLKRGQAYERLAEELGLSRADCHMKIMDAEIAGRVPEAVRRIRAML